MFLRHKRPVKCGLRVFGNNAIPDVADKSSLSGSTGPENGNTGFLLERIYECSDPKPDRAPDDSRTDDPCKTREYQWQWHSQLSIMRLRASFIRSSRDATHELTASTSLSDSVRTSPISLSRSD